MYYETECYVFIISIMRLLVWKNINFIGVLCKRMRNFAPESNYLNFEKSYSINYSFINKRKK